MTKIGKLEIQDTVLKIFIDGSEYVLCSFHADDLDDYADVRYSSNEELYGILSEDFNDPDLTFLK